MTSIRKFEDIEVNEDGIATTKYTPDGLTVPGIYKYSATYQRNEHYNEATSQEREFVINKATTTTITNAIGNTGEQINLIADVTGSNFTVAGGIVQFKVAGTLVGTANVNNGRAIYEYTIDCADESTLQAFYLGVKGTYGASQSSVGKIDVRHETNLFVDNVTLNVNEALNVTGTATYTDDSNTTTNISSASGEFFIDGTKYSNITIENGSFTLSGNLPSYSAGSHTCKVKLTQTDNYKTTEYTFTIYVRHPTTTTAVNVPGSKNETITISANVVDELTQIVTEGNVKFTIDGTDYLEPVVNGVAQHSYTIPSSATGTISFVAQFQQSTNYMTSATTSTGTITIRKDVTVTIQNVEATIGTEATINAVITCDNAPVAEGYVDFEIVEDDS